MSEEIKEFSFENEEYRQTYWHTCSHIMAQAVKRLWPEVKLAIGPSIKEGWYYDMDAPFAFTPEHMTEIEAEMRKICKEKLKLERFELPREEAIKFMEEKNEPYKVELIQDLPGHSQAAGRDRLHRVRTAPSPLQDLFGETLVVNSAHHQAADRLGQGLRAVQWAIDGTVEAVIHQSLPVWGVQWHPERLAGPLSLSGAADGGCLFTAWLALAGGTGQS